MDSNTALVPPGIMPHTRGDWMSLSESRCVRTKNIIGFHQHETKIFFDCTDQASFALDFKSKEDAKTYMMILRRKLYEYKDKNGWWWWW